MRHPEKRRRNSTPFGQRLDQVRDRLRMRHYSVRTEQAYVSWIRRFVPANGKRHPGQMGQAEVEAFLTRPATVGQMSAGTQNHALAALLFLYGEVLRIELPWMENLVRAKRPRRIPVVLSREEACMPRHILAGSSRLASPCPAPHPCLRWSPATRRPSTP